jgi:hypothetical protein
LRLEEFLWKIQFAFGNVVCLEAVLKSNFGCDFVGILSILQFECGMCPFLMLFMR